MILSNKSERRGPRERERVQCESISYTKQARSKQSGRNLGESCLSTKMTKEVTYPCKGIFR